MFILAGFGKLTAIAGTAGWFGSIGLPLPTVTAVVVGLVELRRRPCHPRRLPDPHRRARGLALFTVAATLIAHLDFADQMQILMLQKNLAITGGLLILAAVGAGALSIDARRS